MYNVKDMSWILKSISMHKNDSKGIVKFDFVTLCLTFMGSIPTRVCGSHTRGYMLACKIMSEKLCSSRVTPREWVNECN